MRIDEEIPDEAILAGTLELVATKVVILRWMKQTEQVLADNLPDKQEFDALPEWAKGSLIAMVGQLAGATEIMDSYNAHISGMLDAAKVMVDTDRAAHEVVDEAERITDPRKP